MSPDVLMDEEPAFDKDRFRCPHCSSVAYQVWNYLSIPVLDFGGAGNAVFRDATDSLMATSGGLIQRTTNGPTWRASTCSRCGASAVWRAEDQIFPGSGSGPEPHVDMPPATADIYNEARVVLPASRRAAAALARAALERLLRDRDTSGARKSLDELIADLDGQVSESLWRVLTALRVIGNGAMHENGEPHEIVLLFMEGDAATVVEPFFGAINDLVDELITRPARANKLYDMLPPGIRDGAESKARASASRRADTRPDGA